ncbi:hypothetical protein [Cohnella fermenti]|uniref:Uncharacterized protein n=1 Tax=Cohnella fermenti TaxID=2565925 RepID=A0A4S4BR14_9BACL|nr:hypothetical protein [Cohnella fermenti]THF76592.1 hypothetical protein E6C55_18860 [Cohnella fermenti]
MRTFNKLCSAALSLLLLGAAITAGGPAASAAIASARQPPALVSLAALAAESAEALRSQAEKWIDSLAAQQAFSSWKNAKLDIQALGPGTHGWLITLRDQAGAKIGYLVAYAEQGSRSYRLGEYGLGEQTLFDEASLKRSLYANGLIDSLTNAGYEASMHYIHPLAAVWQVKIGPDTYWLDAKTDELLPLDAASWDSLALRGSTPSSDDSSSNDSGSSSAALPPLPAVSLVLNIVLNEATDPYDRLPWLTGEQPFDAAAQGALEKRLAAKLPLRYVAEPFGDKMLYALSVIGFLRWNDGRLDVALDMNGTRFIPLESLTRNGLFYR